MKVYIVKLTEEQLKHRRMFASRVTLRATEIPAFLGIEAAFDAAVKMPATFLPGLHGGNRQASSKTSQRRDPAHTRRPNSGSRRRPHRKG